MEPLIKRSQNEGSGVYVLALDPRSEAEAMIQHRAQTREVIKVVLQPPILSMSELEDFMGVVLAKRLEQETQHLLETSKVEHSVSGGEGTLKAVIVDSSRQVGVLRSNIGMFVVTLRDSDLECEVIVEGRQVDMDALRELIEDHEQQSRVGNRVFGPRILGKTTLHGQFYAPLFRDTMMSRVVGR